MCSVVGSIPEMTPSENIHVFIQINQNQLLNG